MIKLAQYGGGVFSANCPKCFRPLRIPANLDVNAFMRDIATSIYGKCSKHGKVVMRFLAFDKRDEPKNVFV